MKKNRSMLYVFIFTIMLCGMLLTSKEEVFAAGKSTMYVGQTKNYENYTNTYNTIKSYNWSISGDAAVIVSQSANTCQLKATSTGQVTLSHSITSTYTYYIYTDVQCTKKKYITNTDVSHASWVISIGTPVTVGFDANGGSVEKVSTQVCCGGGSLYGELPTPIRSGFLFDGWYTAAVGGTLVTEETVVTASYDHMLYAHWMTPFAYTIKFDGNGNTGGEMEDMTCIYGTGYELPANAFTKTGNHFVCWCTTRDGTGTRYKNKWAIRNLRKTEGTVTLYAIWSDEVQASGVDGNLVWVVDGEGTLFVSGSGAMKDDPAWRKRGSIIKKVVIMEGVTTISNLAFCMMGDYSIEEVQIPDTVTTIGESAFQGNYNLTKVDIPDSVTWIKKSAFSGCRNLSEITLGKSLTSIGEYAFSECALEQIYLPASVDYIAAGDAFASDHLKAFAVAEDNPNYSVIDGVLFDKSGTVLCSYPAGKSSGTYMVPDGVITIGESAFTNTGTLESIIFPASVKTLGVNCFEGNDQIRHLYFRGEPPKLAKKVQVQGASEETNAFTNVTAMIHYPLEYDRLWTGVEEEYATSFSWYSPKLTWSAYTLGTTMQDCVIAWAEDSIVTYDGMEKQPDIAVSDQDVRLYEGTDYTLSYENNINAGINTAKILLTGLGQYEGTEKEVYFSIEKAQQMPTFAVAAETVQAGGELQIENATGYGEISYKSQDPEIATITAEGLIQAVKVGTVAIEITASGDADHESGTETLLIVVTHDTALAPEFLTAEKKTVQCCIKEKIDLSDLTVKARYRDGYVAEIVGYTTNVEKISTNELGKKTLTISYTENETTLTTELKLEIVKHTKSAAVIEHKIFATTKAEGSYERVVYCSRCKKELSCEKVKIPRLLAKGKSVKDKKTGAVYVVTKSSPENLEVAYKQSEKKTAGTVRIPDSITINATKYDVTSIAKNAFKKNKYISKVTIGKNVKKIGANAFYQCTKLKSIVIQTTKLKLNTVGKNAFKGMKKSVVIKVPKTQYSSYKKILRKRGIPSKARLK